MKKLLYCCILVFIAALCVSCDNKETTGSDESALYQTLIENETKSWYERVDPTDSLYVVSSLMAIGKVDGANACANVAYILLSDGRVLICNESHARLPFTEEQAKLLLFSQFNSTMYPWGTY